MQESPPTPLDVAVARREHGQEKRKPDEIAPQLEEREDEGNKEPRAGEADSVHCGF